MDSYRVVFKPSVEKDLKGLTKALVSRIMKRIEGLADDPFRPGVKLSTAERLYRVRVGDYRIVYEVDSKADRKSTRLNSSHANISYAVFCLKKKKKIAKLL